MSEKHDFFNAPPTGFARTSQGWMQLAQTPQKTQMDKLKVENKELLERLEKIETLLSGIVRDS